MIYKLELNDEQAALLVKLLTDKAEEIHTWQAATGDNRREVEYYGITSLLTAIHTAEEAE